MEKEMIQEIMYSPHQVSFRTVPVPQVLPGQVKVKIKMIGICGSDIHVFHGTHPFTSYPVTQGHEVSGEIVEIGENVTGLRIGQQVTIEPQVFCGKCYPCRHGKYNLCESLKVMGFQTTGTASSYFVVDASKITPLANVLGGVLLTALISVFVMTLSCALGWVVAKISLLKHKSFVTVVISLAFFGAYYFFYFRAMALIQELLANLAVYGAAVKDGAYPIYLFGSVGTGNAKACIIVTVFVAALFALMWALISRSFLETATATGKTARTVYRETTVRQKSIPAALLGREFAHFGASPNYMLNCGLGTFLMPVCALLILWKGGEFLSTVETLLDGLEGSVPVMLSICLCGVASMNDMTAPSVSLEGKSLWLMQSLPVTPWQVLKAKLSMQIILTAVPMALCIVCAAAVYPFLPVQFLMMTLLVMSYVVLMALLGLFLGVKNPILTWTNEISPIKQSAPVMIALFGSFGYTVLLFVGYVALPGWKLGFFGYMGCLAGLNLILCALLYLWLKKKGSARFAEL